MKSLQIAHAALTGLLFATVVVFATLILAGVIEVRRPSIATPTPSGPGQEGSREADLKWARSVVDEFLKAALSAKEDDVIVLMTPGLVEQIKTSPGGLVIWLRPWGRLKTAAITSVELAPAGNEAVFRVDTSTDKWKGPVTLRVVKRMEGLWRVDFVDTNDWK